MQIIFVEPCFPANQREFVRALNALGATVIGIGERPKDSLPEPLRSQMIEYVQVSSVCNEAEMIQAVKWVQSKLWVDRLEATVEAHIEPVARVRAACTIPGTTEQTAFLCRDKPAMKQVLRENGIPCARSLGSGDVEEIVTFANQTGYPLIVKPRSGAGASGTHQVHNEGHLREVLAHASVGRGGQVAVEEFVDGHEAFYDTLCINGRVVHDFVSHYFPNVLEAMRNRWISPQFIATNRLDSVPDYQQVREMGQRVITALGINTSATHMEWFFGKNGLRFSEIGCRPPGVRAWDLYNVGNDIDLYREWASAVIFGRPERSLSRRFSAGIIALRPSGDGRIQRYEGLEAIQQRYGEWIIDCHFPEPGTPTQPVEAGYMANAWLRMKHPDYDQLRAMLNDVGQSAKVIAG